MGACGNEKVWSRVSMERNLSWINVCINHGYIHNYVLVHCSLRFIALQHHIWGRTVVVLLHPSPHKWLKCLALGSWWQSVPQQCENEVHVHASLMNLQAVHPKSQKLTSQSQQGTKSLRLLSYSEISAAPHPEPNASCRAGWTSAVHPEKWADGAELRECRREAGTAADASSSPLEPCTFITDATYVDLWYLYIYIYKFLIEHHSTLAWPVEQGFTRLKSIGAPNRLGANILSTLLSHPPSHRQSGKAAWLGDHLVRDRKMQSTKISTKTSKHFHTFQLTVLLR